jgi:CRISPR-associated protein Cmr1
MQELVYQLSFVTPAFLGNAEQQAQWRTPPIKALIRQWWRVAKARGQSIDLRELRRAEATLFGVAADRSGEDSRRSWLRLRLRHWNLGTLDNAKWPRKEIGSLAVGQGFIPADVYIGYGPVLAASRQANRPQPTLGRTAIAPETPNELRLALDRRASDEQRAELRATLSLCQWFGTLGSRSRNGWGSLCLAAEGLSRLPSAAALEPYLRPLAECFDTDWAHAIGKDSRGALVWSGAPLKNWREAVLALAQTRLAVRAAAKRLGRNHAISANQLIAYPVTKSGNEAWGTRERFASPLRLKVHKTTQGLVPMAVHLPCALPSDLLAKLDGSDQRWVRENQLAVWQAVHQELDQRMRRLGAGT